MNIDKIRIEHMRNPIGIDVRHPLVLWTLQKREDDDGSRQVYWNIKAEGSLGTSWDSGKVQDNSMQYRIPVEFYPKERVKVQVMVWDENGREDRGCASFEMGLRRNDWKASWINPELTIPESDGLRPASYLKKTFSVSLEKDKEARLYATAHGTYNIYLNGQKVEGNVLAPGVSECHKILQYQTYDVTEYLKDGENELLAVVGNGWWRGTVTYDGIRNGFGEDVAFLAQLEYGGQTICMTDESWIATQDGALRNTDLMQGEIYDARKTCVLDEQWHQVKAESFGYDHIEASNCPPIKEHEVFDAEVFYTPNGECVLDFGQNIAGYIGFEIEAEEGEQYCFTHGETLDKDGNFTIENFQSQNFRCEQRIVYTCKEGKNKYKVSHSLMGFRYVKVEGMKAVHPEDFKAYAVYTDLEETARFSCGNLLVDQLVKNAVWSLKGNLADIPTDCPTREKSGFTGDLVTYIHTFQYLMETWPMIQKYVRNLAASQYEDGCVKQIAADPRERGDMDGAGGWSDAFEILPDKNGEWYNDQTLFEIYYEKIKKWADFLIQRAGSYTRPQHMDNPYHDCLDDVGIHWGEWLEPDFDFESYMANIRANGEPEVGTAYLSYACRIVSRHAQRMGRKEEAEYYAAKADRAAAAYRYAFTDNGRIHSERMCRYVRPIVLELLSEEEKRQAAADLNELVKGNGYKLNTGFLTTHELCRVLSDYGYVQTAYNLLLQEEQPGWLHSVKNGMTTIPESWYAFRPDGSRGDSFNHYSYGSVIGWIYGKS